MVDSKLVRKILTGYALSVMGRHGLPHWGRVLENGLRLAESTGAVRSVVAMFAVFHDSRRQNDGIDPGHGRRGAELAGALRGSFFDLSDEEFELLCYACVHHTDGVTDGDVTVQVCWDADRLDLWRVGITPRAEFLCTAAAKKPEVLGWAEERSLKNYTPPYVRDKWLK